MGKPKKPQTKTLNIKIKNNAPLPKEVGLPVTSLFQFGGSRILITFSNSDGSRYYLYSVGLFGGCAIHLLTLPGCGNDGVSPTKPYFLPPVNGLVCFFNGNNVFVCNPSTRKVRNVPLCCPKTSLNSYLYKPYSSYSFGFDSSSKVFKILHVLGLICRNDNKLYNVESRVLTIKTPDEFKFDSYSWRNIASSFPYPYAFRTQGVFVNGSIYWIGKRAPGEETIVSFDVKEEKFRLIPSPPNGVPLGSKLTNIEEKLGIVSFKDYDDCTLELWVYTNYSTWVKKDVGTHVALKRNGMEANFASFVGNGAMLMTPGVLLHNFVLRSLNDGLERGMKILGLPGWVDFLDYKKINFNVYNYVESIVPLDFVIRFGDFLVDLANVRLPKQALPVELLPHVKVEVNNVLEETKDRYLVFGDFEEFERNQKKKLAEKNNNANASGQKYVKNSLREKRKPPRNANFGGANKY